MRKKLGLLIGILFLCWLFLPERVYAMEDSGYTENLLEEMNLAQLQQQLNELMPKSNISLLDMIENAMKGDAQLNLKLVFQCVKESFQNEKEGLETVFTHILMIGILSAVFAGFAHVFDSHQIADASYYMMYLLLITVLLKTFEIVYGTAVSTLDNIILFMKLIIPTLAVSLSIATGTSTAAGFWQLGLLVIFVVENLILLVLIPFIYIYVLLVVVNGVMEEERFGVLLESLKKIIYGFMKISLVAVSGMSMLQKMITPVIDSLQYAAVEKMVTLMPGVGNIADSVSQLVTASAVLVKNSIGTVFMILLALVCAVPAVKIAMYLVILKLDASLIAIVSDKRMAGCAEEVSEGIMMLLKTVLSAMALFLIMTAIIISSARM